MTEANLTPGGHRPCKCLRSKDMYYKAEPFAEDEFSSGIYWCAQTQDAIGPDNQPVDSEDCDLGRECYQSAG